MKHGVKRNETPGIEMKKMRERVERAMADGTRRGGEA